MRDLELYRRLLAQIYPFPKRMGLSDRAYAQYKYQGREVTLLRSMTAVGEPHRGRLTSATMAEVKRPWREHSRYALTSDSALLKLCIGPATVVSKFA